MNNSTEDAADFTIDENVENASEAFPDFPPPFPEPPAMPIATLLVGLVTGMVGMSANGVVLVVLTYGRRLFAPKRHVAGLRRGTCSVSVDSVVIQNCVITAQNEWFTTVFGFVNLCRNSFIYAARCDALCSRLIHRVRSPNRSVRVRSCRP